MFGLRPQTFENLQLNSGTFLEGFDYQSIKDADALVAAIHEAITSRKGVLGATLGGGSFVAAPQMRKIEADGIRYDFKGGTVNDGWDIKLTTTLKEVTSDNMKRALAMADLTEEGQLHKLKIRTDIIDADYMKNVCWVGKTSKGRVLIALENAMNVSGANLTFADKNEGTLPVEFHAYQESVEDNQYAPVEIIFFDPPAAA